ncbi:MAG: outer membrane beta-barrel protein [Chthoniobacterales bacterium]
MKKLFVSALALATFVVTSHGGTPDYSEPKGQQSNYLPTEQLYRDREWNFDLFGTYAFTSQPYRSDRFLGVDHAWGGGFAVSYMFNRYLGAGLEGYGLAADDAVGQASANLIFRYPIPGTRFSPYAYAGGGAIFNGSRVGDLVARPGAFRRNGDSEGMGQFGAGIELRLTPNIGLINDFSWNVVNGDHNDFGIVRSGLRFAF